MKTVRAKSGPFAERPHFKVGEIERVCLDELRAAKLLPATPEPIRVDRFIERRFQVSPRYEQLPDGVLGFTKFGPSGVEDVVIAAQLDHDVSAPARRRLRSTLAHEAGHGLLHAYLFSLGTKPASLFGEKSEKPEILCRDVQGEGAATRYDGRWWEYQANRAIGGLLLPQPLFQKAIEPFMIEEGLLGAKAVRPGQEDEAARMLADIFDVNPMVVRIRINELLGPRDQAQLQF